MPRLLITSRRSLLALVGASALGAVSGCDLRNGTGSGTGRAGAPATDPDQRLLDTAVTEFKVVRERVLRTIERHPATRPELSGVATCLEAHLAALGEQDLSTPTPLPPGPETPTTGATGTDSPGTGAAEPESTPTLPAADQVPDDRDEAVAAVVTALTTHTEALTGWSARAESGPFARLLAVMAAGSTQYLTTLQKVD